MAAMIFNTQNFQSNMRRIQGQVSRQLPIAVTNGGEKLITIVKPDIPLSNIPHDHLEDSGDVNIDMAGANLCLGSVKWNASAPHNGFNYARKQHDEALNHPIKGTQYYVQGNVMGANRAILDVMQRTVLEVL